MPRDPANRSPTRSGCTHRHTARTLRSSGSCCAAAQEMRALEAALFRALAVRCVNTASLALQKKATHKNSPPLQSTIALTEPPVGRRAFQCHVRQPCGVLCTSACPGAATLLQSFNKNNTRDASPTCLLACSGHWHGVTFIEGCAFSVSCRDGSQ